MKAKGLQNWIGVVSLALLIIAVVMLFVNWTVFEDGDEFLPENWEEYYLSGDPEDVQLYESSVGLFRILAGITTKGFSPFAIFIMMLVVVRGVNSVGEEKMFANIVWVMVFLFILLLILLAKLVIQRILGKKAKGILAFFLYAAWGIIAVAMGREMYGIVTPWTYIGLPAILCSIILWIIYCRKMGIRGKQKTPSVTAPYNDAQTSQMPAQTVVPPNYVQTSQMPMQPVAMPVVHCEKCGARLQPGTSFCGNCEALL